MHRSIFLAIAAGFALLSSCASVPMASEAQDAVAKRFAPTSGKSNIYVYRGSGVGTAVTVQTVLDGRIVGALAPNTYHLLSVPPGNHVISTGGGLENVDQVTLSTRSGGNYFVKLSMKMGLVLARVDLTNVDNATGQAAVAKMKRASAVAF